MAFSFFDPSIHTELKKMNSKKAILSRIGMMAKGIVYLLIGILTTLPILGMGGKASGSKDTLTFLAQQPFGKVLLILIGFSLLAYLFFRCYQAFANLKNHKKDAKGYAMRASYVFSGLVYGFLGFTALKMAFGGSSGNSSSVSKLLNSEYGHIIAIIVAIGLTGKAIYEFHMAYSGKFKDEVNHANISSKARNLLLNAGKIGFTARGIVAAILAFLFFKAGFKHSGGDINRADAFNLLQNEVGAIVMTLVAVGIAAYGMFMVLKSKYPNVNLQ